LPNFEPATVKPSQLVAPKLGYNLSHLKSCLSVLTRLDVEETGNKRVREGHTHIERERERERGGAEFDYGR